MSKNFIKRLLESSSTLIKRIKNLSKEERTELKYAIIKKDRSLDFNKMQKFYRKNSESILQEKDNIKAYKDLISKIILTFNYSEETFKMDFCDKNKPEYYYFYLTDKIKYIKKYIKVLKKNKILDRTFEFKVITDKYSSRATKIKEEFIYIKKFINKFEKSLYHGTYDLVNNLDKLCKEEFVGKIKILFAEESFPEIKDYYRVVYTFKLPEITELKQENSEDKTDGIKENATIKNIKYNIEQNIYDFKSKKYIKLFAKYRNNSRFQDELERNINIHGNKNSPIEDTVDSFLKYEYDKKDKSEVKSILIKRDGWQ